MAHSHHTPGGGGELVRFSVAMPEELLMRFDSLVARRGVAKNRSEVVRDLVREALIEGSLNFVQFCACLLQGCIFGHMR